MSTAEGKAGAAHPQGAEAADPELAAMDEKIQYWEQYVKDQQAQRTQAADLVQQVMDQSGLSAKGVDPADPALAEIALDLEFQRQVSLHYGLKLDKATPVDNRKPDASQWRQRTRAMRV